MKVGRLLEVSLYASDLGAAECFYHDVLGLEIVSNMEGRGISFRCGEMVLLVFNPARTRLPDAGVPTHGATGEGHIAFATDESEFGSWARAITGTRRGNRVRGRMERWQALALLSRSRRERGGICAAHFVAHERRADQSLNSVTTRVALWPPKPNELLTATRIFFSRATFAV
jgi:catechol 2,3-dioxygenase-like lactoylglutathione lyase family enzyme